MRLLTALLALTLSTGLTAQDETTLLKDFEKAFGKSTAKYEEAKQEAIASIEGFDSPAVARALVEAYAELEQEVTPLENKRRSILKRGGGTTDLAKLRVAVQAIHNLQAQLIAALDARTEPGSIREMVTALIRAKKPLPLTLQLALARRAGELAGDDVATVLERAEGKRGDADLLILLSTLAGLGARAQPAARWATALLEHDSEDVRVEAANALSTLVWPGSIEPLVARMEHEQGRTLEHFVEVLHVLTGENPGPTAESWRRWLAAEGEPWVRGEVQLGLGSTPQPEKRKRDGTGTYFGIPQDGNAIIYVFDASMSMNRALVGEVEADTSKRVHLCKRELRNALSQLSDDKTFNVIAFANELQRFSSKMEKANPRTIKRAIKWVDAVELEWETNIYDGLELAFAIAGRGTGDRYYPMAADTIFLLSDGEPTVRNVGQRPGVKKRFPLDRNPEILAAVRRWNPYGRVVVHTIGLGIPKRRPKLRGFLQQLADQNGGKFVER